MMDGWLIAMMIGASTLLGAFGLWGLMWGIKSGQFDDHQKFLDGAQCDSEEALQDAVMMEKQKEEAKKKMGYAPPD